MNQFWDERYRVEEYVYGKEPNTFFKSRLENYKPGHLLLPGEGEGRNAVYAASLGWKVTAFDTSTEGRSKALKLAKEKGVSINYEIASYHDFSFEEMHYDMVALFFTHQPEDDRKRFHRKLADSMNPGSILIFEGFHKKQINRNTGGPQNIEFLFDEAMILTDFANFEFLELTSLTRELNEGPFHQGVADVIQGVARKL